MIFWVTILAAILRLYRVEPNLVFHGELGDNYLAIKNITSSGQIPTLGPATSHPWLSFGPLFYWLMSPVMALSKFNPVSGAYFMTLVQILLVVINYIVIKRIFTKRVAQISSFFIAISPLFISLTRESRFFSLVTFFFYPFLYFLISGNLFLCGLSFGVMLNFHLTPIVLIPPALIYLVKRKTSFRSYLQLGLGFLIPSLPFIIYNFTHGFEMLKNFTLWIPYRVAGFVGAVPKNSPTWTTLMNNLYSLGGFVSSSFLYRFAFGSVFVLIVFAYVIYVVKKNWSSHKISNEFLLVLMFIFGYAGIFIHGNPPSHYYLPLYSMPIIFVSIILSKIKSKELISGILVIVAVLNLRYFFSKSWFYQDTSKIFDNKEVPYELQLEAAGVIAKDADGRKFSLKRVGQYDYFEKNYSQNYIYLLNLDGNEPVDNSRIIYTIWEKPIESANQEMKIYEKGGLSITKVVKE